MSNNICNAVSRARVTDAYSQPSPAQPAQPSPPVVSRRLRSTTSSRSLTRARARNATSTGNDRAPQARIGVVKK